MSARSLLVPMVMALALALSACGGDEPAEPAQPSPSAQRDDGGALGGGASTETLARATDLQVPDGEVAWVTRSVTLEPGERLRHEHAFATVYAHRGAHELTADDDRGSLGEGAGAAVPAGSSHVHAAGGDEPSVFWETFLGEPGAELPGAADAELVFESDPLEGIPESPALQFILVELPPGTATSVHTHPGPEFIYGIEGSFTYENGIEGERDFGPGDQAGIPPDTAVQKRNDTRANASFLSWFLVDPEQPFAPGTEFPG